MRAHSIALELLEIAKRAEDKGVLRIRRGQSLPRGVWGAAYYDGQEQSLVVDISADCPTEWRDLALAHELVHIARVASAHAGDGGSGLRRRGSRRLQPTG